MKKFVVIIFIALPIAMWAQENNPCAQINEMYDKKVEEILSLKTKLSDLESEIISVRKELDKCRKDNAYLQQKLSSQDSMKKKQYQDSISALNESVNVLQNIIKERDESIIQMGQRAEEQDEQLKLLNAIEVLLASKFDGASVDELYQNFDKRELSLYIDLYKVLSKTPSEKVSKALICFKAYEQLSQKYDKVQIAHLQKQLPQDTKSGKQLSTLMLNYEDVNQKACALWKQIHEEVCAKPIDAAAFDQVQAKRKIWQFTQKYLNTYPTLSEDYPYIEKQLQSMLRQIWQNANNFNNINNPFE